LIGCAVLVFKKIVDLHPPCAPDMLKYYTSILTNPLGEVSWFLYTFAKWEERGKLYIYILKSEICDSFIFRPVCYSLSVKKLKCSISQAV
jgi:hypothetical protein